MSYKDIQKENKAAWKRSRVGYKPQIMKDSGNVYAVFLNGTIYHVTHAGYRYAGVVLPEKVSE